MPTESKLASGSNPRSVPATRAHPAVPALLLTLGCAWAAQAAPIPPYVAADVDISSAQSGTSNHDSGALALPFVSQTNSASGSTPNGSAVSAAGSASADAFGTLKVDAAASASTAPTDFPAVHIGISAIAERAETFHFLPAAGTTISFLATLEWSGGSSGGCPAVGSCEIGITDQLLDLDHGGAALISNDFFYNTGDPLHASLPPGTQSVRQVWSFSSAATFDVLEILRVELQALGLPSSSVSSDLSHTGHFYLDPITPGATYTTASGNLYLTPAIPAVPEPATLALLLAAVPALTIAARRRGRARAPAPRRLGAGR